MATPEYAAGTRDHSRTARDLVRGCPSGARAGSTGSRPPTTRRSGSSTCSRPPSSSSSGGVEALLMRIQLGAPDNTFLDPTTYNQLFTMHGTTMIFLVVVPISAGFGELPRAAHDRRARHGVPAPQHALVVAAGRSAASCSTRASSSTPPSAGWTSYAPLSDDAFLPGHGIDAWILALHLVGHLVDPRRDQLHRDDPQHARARACRSAGCRCSSGRS